MKHSIRFKITLALSIMIILTIFMAWFINRTFLSDYYVFTKTKNLDTAYQQIKEIYDKAEDDKNLSETDTLYMEQLASRYSVDIYVINSVQGFIYPTSLGERELQQMLTMQAEYLGGFLNPNVRNRRVIKTTSNYTICSLYDRQKEISYIDMVGFIDTTIE